MSLERISGAALSSLQALIEGGGNSKQIAKDVKKVYEQLVGEYRPFVEALPEITELVGKDLAPSSRPS